VGKAIRRAHRSAGGVAILVLGEAANRTPMYLAAALIIGYGVWVIVRTLRRR